VRLVEVKSIDHVASFLKNFLVLSMDSLTRFNNSQGEQCKVVVTR